ncbi:hypothetical protein [Novipirellula sp.]|uniref:hypothetical protein n=1 Tax=Novipirellula sp. TaxID=2795430 RepID=UPI0035625B7F
MTLHTTFGGSLDDVMMDVALSESSVVDGDVVFAKITLTNSGSSAVEFQTIDPLRHLDVTSRELIAAPYAIVGHRAIPDGELQRNDVTRLNPKEGLSFLVMVRILAEEFLHGKREPQAIHLEFTARLLRTPDELSKDKDPHLGEVRAKIVGQIVSVPMVAALLRNHRFLAFNPEWVMGDIHGGLTVERLRFSSQRFIPHPGMLNSPAFPLKNLARWQEFRDELLIPDSVLYRLASNSLAYDAIRQNAKLSDAECFQRIRNLIQESPPMERWWMLDQIHQDPKLKHRRDLVAKIEAVLDAYPLDNIQGAEPQPIRKLPSQSLQVDIELSEHQIIDGDLLFLELNFTNQSDGKIYIHYFWLEKSLEVRFPSSADRRSMVISDLLWDDGYSLGETYQHILVQPRATWQKTALIRLPSLFPQLANAFKGSPRLLEVEISLRLYSSAAEFPRREVLQSLGEITGKRLSLPLYGNILRDKNPNPQAIQQIHGIQRFVYAGGHAFGDNYKLQQTVPLFRKAEFPLKPLPMWKYLRENSIRDDTVLARLIDTSIDYERITDENEDWRTQHAQILELIKDSPRIEKKWLYYFLSHDLSARMDLNVTEHIEFYQLQRETEASLVPAPSATQSEPAGDLSE